MYRLTKHKDVYTQVQQEIDGLSNNHSDDIDYAAIQQLEYTHAVFSEVLRLHPSVPKDPKQVVAHDTLPDGSEVHPGDVVFYSPYSAGRCKEFWANSQDFNPSRFIDDKKPSPYKFTAFQAGPRMCTYAFNNIYCVSASVRSSVIQINSYNM